MAEAQIIQLFQRPKPPAEDSEFWRWGQNFVEDGINNLEAIVEEMGTCQSEEALKACVQELRAEVESWPDF